jgi:Zn-dependent peptidase ImmA (M78 family)
MTTVITINKNKNNIFEIDREVFETLFNHTVARRRTKFVNALDTGAMQHDDFIDLTRAAEVPYPLFFLDIAEVQKVILEFEKIVYFGVSKDQMSIASRGEITLADISLILKDITRKQGFIKKYIDDDNDIPGMFKRKRGTVVEQAEALRVLLGYDIDAIENMSKEKTYNLLSEGLAKKNVFISLYAHNYSPQTIDRNLQFSGIAINDKKCPFLFIKAGDNHSKVELWGRRLFTAALLLSCLCCGDCGPLTMDGKSGDLIDDEHYLFAEEFLMPEVYFAKESLKSLSDVNSIASKYSVSNSAVIMRGYRLHMIDEHTKEVYLSALRLEWDALTSKKGGGQQLGLEKAINRYNNPAVVRLIIDKCRSNNISVRDAKNLLCYKKGDSFNIEALESHV